MTEQLTKRPPLLTDGGAELLSWLKVKRETDPVWTDGFGMRHVFRFDDVQHVLSDPATFSSDFSRALPSLTKRSKGMLTQIDPPMHRNLRRLVSTAFTPKMVASLQPRITEITTELLAAVPAGEFDLVEQLAYPLPVTVIAEMLGIPGSDRELFRGWADKLLSLQVDDPTDPNLARIIEESRKDMDEYLLAQCLARRENPKDDLISRLVLAEIDGQQLDDEELVNFSSLLLLAGHITTTTLLGNAMLCLQENPAAAAELRADRSLIPAAIEEVLRVRTPFTRTARVTTTDVEVAGVHIAADTVLAPNLLSANHDERHFPDPDRFDIHRDPNQQVGFGHGIHFCLGAPLARLEGKIAINLLLDAFSDLSVIRESAEFYRESIFGVRALRMTARRD